MATQQLLFQILADSSKGEADLASFGDKVKGIAQMVSGAVGALKIGSLIADNMQLQDVQRKLEAQVAGFPEVTGKAGALAGEVFSQNFGSSIGETSDAIRDVIQSGASNLDGSHIKELAADGLTLAGVFGTDVKSQMNAVSQIMRNDMAPNAQAAFDVITTGLGNGADKADDLLDTFNEYSVQFRNLGLDAKESLGLLTQGLKAGARDADTVADALKEFNIRGQTASYNPIDTSKVAQAKDTLAQAEAAMARDTEAAATRITAAKRTVATAVATAAEATRRAAEQVGTAEAGLATAQQASRAAQDDLTKARQQAADQLAALADQVINASLAERGGVLALTKAKEDLAAVRNPTGPDQTQITTALAAVTSAQEGYNRALAEQRAAMVSPSATAAAQIAAAGAVQAAAAQVAAARQRLSEAQAPTVVSPTQEAEAQLAVDRATQSLKEQRDRVRDVAAEQASATKTGVEGSDLVVQARARLSQAQQGELDAQRVLQAAQRERVKTELDGLTQVGDAETALAAARQEGAQSQAADLDAIGKAQQALTAALTPQITAVGQAYAVLGIDGAAASAKLAAGGAGAKEVLQQVLDRLRLIKDPVEQSQIAVALFGTKAEDLQKSLLALNPATAVAGLGQVDGATNKLAATMGDNAVSKVQALKNQFGLWQASLIETNGPIGTVTAMLAAFGPTILQVLAVASPFAAFMAGPLTQGVLAGARAVGTFSVTLLTSPITWIVLGIVAAVALLAAGVYLVINNWSGISKWFGDLWAGVQHWFSGFIDWVVNGFLNFTPLGLIIKNWGPISKFFSDFWGGIVGMAQDAGNWIGEKIDWIIKVFQNIPTAVRMTFDGMAGFFKDTARNIAVGFANLWNSTIGSIAFDVPGWVPFIGGNHVQFPHITIPALAAGGVVTAPTLALIGEAGPEAVIPLNRLGAAPAAPGAGVTEVHLHLPDGLFVGTADELARKLYDLLMGAARKGTVPAPSSWGKKQ